MTVPPSSPSSSSHDSSPPSLRPVSEVSMEELPDFDSEATGRQSPQEYRVQHCVAFSDQPPAYYAFRIVPQETCLGVRIGAPGSRYDPPTCSCDVFRDTPHGCPHVEWLSRQLADVASRSPYHADTIKSHSAFSVLDSIGLPQVAEHLEWPVREQPSTAADRVFSVEEQVRDMLSTFAADGRLPEDDLARAQATMQDDTAPKEELRSCKTLESFIFRLALKDDEVFRALRDALNPDHCASIYLDKLDTRATALLGGEDPSTKARAHGTEETADSLRHIADKIRASLELRAPVSPGVKSQACQILSKPQPQPYSHSEPR
ncbi:MAG: hypothetical protein M1838_002324 [Thelocarpon superellum]|nr:MAG: hypothetical protein M1838_002324 [Thelocarpon superellum]